MATKNDLLKSLSNKIDYLSKEDISDSLDLILDYLKEELTNQNRIEIRGFGSFSTRDRKYAGHDKSYKTVYYRMAKAVADDINK